MFSLSSSILKAFILCRLVACSNVSTSDVIIPLRSVDDSDELLAVTATTKTDTIPQDSINYLLGKFQPETQANFVEIESIHANRKGMYLHKTVYEAFVEMYKAAKEDGIKLKIISATRNFNHQKRIWESKWTGKRLVEGKDLSKMTDLNERALTILRFSSMPGTSRHHWGTDIDINSLSNSYFESGKGLKEFEWLLNNASSFGFCQPYTEKGVRRPTGYEEEKWHWSYMPLSSRLTELYSQGIIEKNLTDFLGSEVVAEINMIAKYVLGIDTSCAINP